MSSTIRCPECRSYNVECLENPHRHKCLNCGFDGSRGSAVILPDDWLTAADYTLSPGDMAIVELCAKDLNSGNVDLYRRTHERHARQADASIATLERQLRAAKRSLAMRRAMIETIDKWKEANPA